MGAKQGKDKGGKKSPSTKATGGDELKSTAKSTAKSKGKAKGNSESDDIVLDEIQNTRETVESVVVAFILAFLFRAFVAEAFVIPTGSMAPTLMGAHKDLVCQHCGQPYQANASNEYDSNTGALLRAKTFASFCSNCRGPNAYDFDNNKNHSTFSGDRILVSKFDYVLSKPKRWDVFVFKYPSKARVNYIKRLVGLPGETLELLHGDVYIVDNEKDSKTIARKPPHKIQAMKQLVHDSEHIPVDLVKVGWPSSWQPLTYAGDAWDVEFSEAGWSAQLGASNQANWLRYYHKFPTNKQWEDLRSGSPVEIADRYESRLITDYLAYNTQVIMRDAFDMFEMKESSIGSWMPKALSAITPNPRFMPDQAITEGRTVYDTVMEEGGVTYKMVSETNDGLHWVGDLSGEFEVEVESEQGELLLEVIEFGIHFECAIDIATGKATLSAREGDSELSIFYGESTLTADTGVKGAGKYRLEFSNFDEALTLWVNGRVVSFDNQGGYDLGSIREGSARRPYYTTQDPLDAAPVGIGGRRLAMKVNAARVYRDIYYLNVQTGQDFCDYPGRLDMVRGVVPDAQARERLRDRTDYLAAVYSHPEWWNESTLFDLRRSRQYVLEDKQYFPMGDNSMHSYDGRAWFGHHYVEEQFLLGKALLVFWPHTWNTPVPFTPNIGRMGRIR
ncbi:MAG: signal peptidase I [Planctomycetota bacterium]